MVEVQLLLERDLTRIEGLWDHTLIPCWRKLQVSRNQTAEYLLDVTAIALDMPQEHLKMFVLSQRATQQHRFKFLDKSTPLSRITRTPAQGIVVLCILAIRYDMRTLRLQGSLWRSALPPVVEFNDNEHIFLIVKFLLPASERLLCLGGLEMKLTDPLSIMIPWLQDRLRYLEEDELPLILDACQSDQQSALSCYEEFSSKPEDILYRDTTGSANAEGLYNGDILVWQIDPGWAANRSVVVRPLRDVVSSSENKPSVVRQKSRSRSPRLRRQQGELCDGLWTSRKFADAKVVCAGTQFRVHRAILCQASPVFDSAFSGSMREAADAQFEVKNSTPEAVEAMLKYMYTGEVPAGPELMTLPLLELAAQYELTRLLEKLAGDLLADVDAANVYERVQVLKRHVQRPQVAPAWDKMLDVLSHDRMLLACSLGHGP